MICRNKIDPIPNRYPSNGHGDGFVISTMHGIGSGCGSLYASVLGSGHGDGYEFSNTNMNKGSGVYPRILVQYWL